MRSEYANGKNLSPDEIKLNSDIKSTIFGAPCRCAQSDRK